ncbi:MAG: transaldolase family protein, partial [Thermaurantiacus tibetensis]
SHFYSAAHDSAENREYVAAFRQIAPNMRPNFMSVGGFDGMRLIADIVQIYRNYPQLKTEVLVASVRHPIHLVESAKLGAHVATLPPGVIRMLLKHPLTDRGLEAFLADWKKTGQSIL